jgi:hypothetical protein
MNYAVDNFGPSVAARYPQGLIKQGVAAERVMACWKLDREALDAFALTSPSRGHRCDGRPPGVRRRHSSPVATFGSTSDSWEPENR